MVDSKKVILLVAFAFFLLPAVFALNVNIAGNNTDAAMINDINEPIVFNLQVTNLGPSDSFQFYNLLGFTMYPVQPVPIASGETKNVSITIYPRDGFNYNGYYIFNYFVQNSAGDKQQESLSFRVLNLQNAFDLGASEISPQSSSITIFLKNKVNFNFQDINATFSSPFFTQAQEFPLGPYEEKQFQISLNRNDFKSLLAGFYTLSASITAGGKTTGIQNSIDFSEKNILVANEVDSGFLIFTKTIEKSNEGNVVADSQTIITKNIISRLFTTLSPVPDSVERKGLLVYYTWENQIQPGDVLTITARTNWLLPLFIILFIGAVVFLVLQYSRTALTLNKRVSYLRAKGGEFALKVSVTVSARKFVERVHVVDRIPMVARLYDKFGNEKPSRVDEHTKRLEWHFDKLQPGETRVLSYIIYSKVGVLGRFALPTTKAVYEKDGKTHEAESNRSYLITEQEVRRE